jgi:hypothetical protein
MFLNIDRRPTVTRTQQEKITAALSQEENTGVQIGGRFTRNDETVGPYIRVISLARARRASEECTNDANWGEST